MADPIVDAILSNQQNREFWQGTLRNLVQTIAQIPQMRQQAQERQALAQERYAQAQDRMAVLQERQQKAADLQALDQAFRQPGGREQILSRVPGHLQPVVLKHFADVDKSNLEYQTALGKAKQVQQDNIARVLFGVRDIGEYSPEAAQTAISTIKASYPDDQQLQGYLGQVEQQLHQNPTPEFVKKFVDSALMQSEEGRKAQEAQQKIKQGELAITKATQETTGTTPMNEFQKAEIEARKASEARAEAAQKATENYQNRMATAAEIRARRPVGVAGGSTEKLSDDSVNYQGAAYRLLGPSSIPTRISGDDRVRIINAATKISKSIGESPADATIKRLVTKGDSASLTQLAKMSGAADSFESKALAQVDLIKQLSPQVPRTSLPIVNAALQSGRTNITGDENATKFANAVQTFAEEYAKIMTGATGSSAAATDSARTASRRLINTAMNEGTLTGILDQMKWEMRQTMNGYGVAREHITNRIGGIPATPDIAAPKPVGRYNPATGKVEPIKE